MTEATPEFKEPTEFVGSDEQNVESSVDVEGDGCPEVVDKGEETPFSRPADDERQY